MPLSWLQQEELEKPIILKKFWEERVLHPKDAEQKASSINSIKNYFLLALPKPGMSEPEWEVEVNRAWDDGSAFSNEEASSLVSACDNRVIWSIMLIDFWVYSNW